MGFKKQILWTAAFCIGLTTTVSAFEINEMTPEERGIFRQEVRSYLLENPEVLMEAIAVLEQRQTDASAVSDVDLISTNGNALFSDGFSYEGGNPDGDIVMVEFLDYKCGFCKKAHPEVAELIRTDGNIKYIVKEFPILGEQSVLASRFAISVLQNTNPEIYAEVNNTLMMFRGEISLTTLERVARDLDLDVDVIMQGMTDPSVTDVIAQNRALAQRMQINGTPGFVIGDQMVRGYAPLKAMQEIVADIRLASR